MNTNQILNKVRELLGMEVKLETMKLDDNITIIEAESFESGMEVVVVTEDEQKIPLPVGSYNLEDGRVLVVAEEGIISEVKEKEEEPEVEVEVPATEEEPMEEEMSTEPAQTIKKTIESVVKETFFAEMEALKKENEELKAQLLSKEVQLSEEEEVVEPIVFNPENVQKIEGFKFASKAGNSTLNNILNKINK
jgi:signal recognition particle GTPase